MKYRKKPVVIEAIQYLGEAGPILDFLAASECESIGFRPSSSPRERGLIVKTLEGAMVGNYGDWLIRGVKGELYPCKDEVFTMTYEPADEATS